MEVSTIKRTINNTPPNVLSTLFQNKSARGLSEYTKLELLAHGSFGIVLKAQNLIDNQQYAIKNITTACTIKHFENLIKEIRTYASLDHENVVRYYTSWIDIVDHEDDNVAVLKSTIQEEWEKENLEVGTHLSKQLISAYIAMEPMTMSLNTYIVNQYGIKHIHPSTWNIIMNIAHGLLYLHELSLIHGDLSTKNVLLKYTMNGVQAKICDFGESNLQQDTIIRMEQDDSHIEKGTNDVFVQFSQQYDIYCFALVIFQLITSFGTSMERFHLCQKFKERKIVTNIDIVDKMVMGHITNVETCCECFYHEHSANLKLVF